MESYSDGWIFFELRRVSGRSQVSRSTFMSILGSPSSVADMASINWNLFWCIISPRSRS